MRNKLENVCLIGILPGPREPQHNVNSFINPLVEDLLQFWNGVQLSVSAINERKIIRCAVICAACDLPAGRKLCGFLGHSARLECSKCKKEFVGGVSSMDYSGFNRETWECRTGNGRRNDATKLLKCSSKNELQVMESQYGCWYLSFLKLPYFNAPRMLTIDPMHNLFLGIAKHHLHKIFIGRGILGSSEFELIQQRVDGMVVPPEIGSIPTKIRSGFSSFTADQFKNWVVHYSLIALEGLLSTEWSGEESTLSEATKFANSYRKNRAGPTFILSVQLLNKMITKSFTYTETPCGHAQLFLRIQNCFSALIPSSLDSTLKWVQKGCVKAGKETAVFVEDLPFDVTQHRIHDPSVVVHCHTTTLTVSIAQNLLWGGGY